MSSNLSNALTLSVAIIIVATAAGCAPSALEAPRPVQPGAPGEATRPATTTQANNSRPAEYVQADVEFMQGMIAHHAQALAMAALVPARTDDEDIRLIAERIEVSQNYEIGAMQNWLAERGEMVPTPNDAMHEAMAHHEHMPGMITPQQMAELEAARGDEFDQLFLRFMIGHHLGALTMVDQLFATPGAGQESEVFQIAEGIAGDQKIEINRMRQLLVS
ncbi:MAG TPA: DUF305 domain-containing protein [Longimicrobiaceae bacterium]|nr:DUF305 domain-containing protein [Longimicrobiaceae bacterium]